MLLGGVEIKGPRIETVVIPFGERELVFKAQLVRDYVDFDKICPRPEPSIIVKPGGVKSQDIENPEYKQALVAYAMKRSAWTILKSLDATPDLVWQTVDRSNPDTWNNYYKELEESGLSTTEIVSILDIVQRSNGLDQDKIDEATKRFLALPAGQKES